MKEKKSKKEWIKTIAIIFLSVLLVLTFFSNTIMNYSLPEVSAQYCYSDMVTNRIRGTGVVEANDPYSVTVKESRKIESVAVRNGDTVEKGDVLYVLTDGESEELKAAMDELKAAQNDYEQAVISGAVSSDITDSVEKEGAGTLASNQAKITAAKSRVESCQAKVDYLRKQSENFSGGSENNVTEKKNLKDAQAQLKLYQAQNVKDSEALSSASITLENAKTEVSSLKADIDAKEASLKKNSDVSSNDYGSMNPGEVYDLENEIKEDKARLKTLEANQKKYQKTYDSALLAYNNSLNMIASLEAAIESYQTAIDDKSYSLTSQLKDAEEALTKAEKDYQELLSDLSTKYGLEDKLDVIKKKQEAVDELKANSIGGTITAPISGTIVSMNYIAGQTIDLASSDEVATIQKAGDLYSLSMPVTINQSQLISIGDEAEVANSWYYSDIHARVTQIRPDPSNPTKSKLIIFELEGNDLTNGQNLTLTVGNRTSNYDMVVPNSAIREDNNGKFILKIKSKNTPLGTRYIAERVDVKVLAEDDRNTAISANMDSWEFIITTTSKPIENGQQVRLKE